MKTLLLVVLSYCFALSSHAQIYGQILGTADTGFTPNFETYWDITTGSNDTGFFTHIGFRHQTNGNYVGDSIKMAIFSDNNNIPDQLLVETGAVAYEADTFNYYPLQQTYPLQSNTKYHIAMLTKTWTGATKVQTASNFVRSMGWASGNFSTGFSSSPNPNMTLSQDITLYLIANEFHLPVEMASFSLEKNMEDRSIDINWSTAQEQNNAGWNIQRSENGFSWNNIGWHDGNGDAVDEIHYQFIDNNPLHGNSLYRLEQKDLDGKTSYSDIRAIEFDRDDLQIFPNPANDFISLEGFEKGEVEIYNVQGEKILVTRFDGKNKIDVNQLISGQYSVNVKSAQGTKSFIITKI